MSKQSSFVPNSFQTPNKYVDELMPLLTGEEYKVLMYATRRILGFQKRQDRISLSQFTNGTKNKHGKVLDHGTGLSIETVKKCLASLTSFGLMVRVAENDPKTNQGTLWSLQWNGRKVDWKGLEKRDENKARFYSKRMSKARSMRQTPPNGIEGGPPNGIEATPPNGIETQNTEETQGNPELINSACAIDLFKGYFGRLFSVKETNRWTTIYEAVGHAKAESLIEWAFKKEIHLTNRGGLLDSLETAAKNWHGNTDFKNRRPDPSKPPEDDTFLQDLAAKKARLRAEREAARVSA